MERREGEEVSELSERVRESLGEELNLQRSEYTMDDVKEWLEGQQNIINFFYGKTTQHQCKQLARRRSLKHPALSPPPPHLYHVLYQEWMMMVLRER